MWRESLPPRCLLRHVANPALSTSSSRNRINSRNLAKASFYSVVAASISTCSHLSCHHRCSRTAASYECYFSLSPRSICLPYSRRFNDCFIFILSCVIYSDLYRSCILWTWYSRNDGRDGGSKEETIHYPSLTVTYFSSVHFIRPVTFVIREPCTRVCQYTWLGNFVFI